MTTLFINHLNQHGNAREVPTFSGFLVLDFLFPQPAIIKVKHKSSLIYLRYRSRRG